MDIQKRKRKAWLNFLGSLLFCMAMAIMVVGTAWARLEDRKEKEVSMVYEAKTEQITLREVPVTEEDNVTVPENTKIMKFILSNETEKGHCSYDQLVKLSLRTTLGIADPENLLITLTDGANVYQASSCPIVEGTSLYSQYGAGWFYQFYNEAGEELSWDFSGTSLSEREMMLTVTGVVPETAMLSLVVDSRPKAVNSDILTMQMKPMQEVPTISSNLLVEGGQTILLNADAEEMVIPITIHCENFEKVNYIAGSINAESSDEERLQVSVDKKAILLYEEGNTIQLTMKLMEPEVDSPVEEPKEPQEPQEPEPEVEQPEEKPQEPQEPEVEQPREEPQEPQEPQESQEPESVAKVHFLNWTLTGTAAEDSGSDEELYAEISFTIGDQVYSAKLVIQNPVQVADMTGKPAFYPSQYHPSGNFVVKGNPEHECVVSGFPAMTKYTVNGQTYLLYDDGSIRIPAGKDAVIDLSKTGIAADLTLNAGGEKNHIVKYVELPAILEENYQLVFGKEGGKLPISRKWGILESTITIEHLTESEDDSIPVWEAVENVKTTVDDKENLQITPEEAPAGTYRAVVSWNEGGITLNWMEIPFFIQYTGTYQGGIGNDQ